jgi:hypothetical protein
MDENKKLKESLGAGGMVGGGSDPEAQRKLLEAEEQMKRN